MYKKVIPVLIIILLLVPSLVAAGTYECELEDTASGATSTGHAYYNGLVPCGRIVCQQGGDFTSGQIEGIEQDLKNGQTFENACGGTIGTSPCQFPHFLVMIDNIIDFLLIKIIPSIALLMIVISGIMFYLSGANPNLRKKAINALKYTVIGLSLIYGSYIIVSLFFTVIGVAQWTNLQSGWFNIGENYVPTVFY